jgi:16S rRNA (cytosine967-C5)-methyltransferase
MTLLDYTYQLFKDIKEKGVSFSYTLNKKINELSLTNLEINSVKACLKGVINRYYYLKFELKKDLSIEDEELVDYLILGLSYVRYVNNVTVNDVIAFINESENEFVKNVDLEKLVLLYNSLKDVITPIPEKYENNFAKKVSILYSYPEWLVGMLKKHFGGKNTYKSIASSRRNTPINIVINPNSELFELNDPDFRKIEITDSSYEYISKTPLIENQLFKEKKIYVLDAMEELLVEELNPFQGDEVLVIAENKSMLVSTIALKMFNFGKVYYSCGNQESYFNCRKTLDLYNISTVTPFEGDISLVCTHAKEKSLDKVLVIPPNSEFGLIRRKPEILINFKQNSLDSLINNQKEYLLEASKFIKDDGLLIYAAPTLNIKETYNIVRLFIESNPDFEVEKEKMIFPHQYQTSGMYYAKIRKKIRLSEEINND